MKLSNWAKKQGIHYMTAYRWFNEGLLPVKATQLPSGTILVEESPVVNNSTNKETHIYCRVSSHNKKDDLERQIQRCIEFCNSNGWAITSITKEIASGMNDKRPKLTKLLNSNPQRLVVEHKDRLTRFGFNYFDLLLPKMNCELVVMNKDYEEEHDLMKDLISLITSFCCRLYGLRKGRNKATKIKTQLQTQDD
jgi:putative resolvase